MNNIRNYLSLGLLFIPALLFFLLLLSTKTSRFYVSASFPFFSWELYVMIIFGGVATFGGISDWKYHRNPLNLKLPQKERNVEAIALGLGGLPMFLFMGLATFSTNPNIYLIPIILVLIYTIVAICYDEFVFHRKRCGREETIYHRMLVFGNGIAWFAWFIAIYVDIP